MLRIFIGKFPIFYIVLIQVIHCSLPVKMDQYAFLFAENVGFEPVK